MQFNRTGGFGVNAGLAAGANGMPSPLNFDYRGMSAAMGNHTSMHGLPKLDMHALNGLNMSDALRTAPPMGSFAQQTGFDLDQLFSPGTTINPAQLHFGGSFPAAEAPLPDWQGNSQHPWIPEGDDFAWMRNWNMQIPQQPDANEQAIEESSPSQFNSGDSPDDYSESMNNSQISIPMPNNFQWSQHDMPSEHSAFLSPFHLESLGTGLPALDPTKGTLSPLSMHDPTPTTGAYFDQAMLQHNIQPQQSYNQPNMAQGQMPVPMSNFFTPSNSNFSSDSPSIASSSMAGSARQSSVTSISTDSITDATRHALLLSLSQPSVFGHNHRKYSQPSVSSPLSPGAGRTAVQGPSLPSTADIRRYVDAFIQFAHVHLPICHVPTVTFEVADISGASKGMHFQAGTNQPSMVGGGGCLILAMAAIGALYEYDHPASKELFDGAKKLIGLYLEERRRADMSAAVNGSSAPSESGAANTPLWLVQAMLLNVIYGHQCGDKTSADIASNHCAALVSLARAAELARPPGDDTATSDSSPQSSAHRDFADVEMAGTDTMPPNQQSVSQAHSPDLRTQWLQWKEVEERKRTLFAIFILSSLLTTAYNQTPTIMNSEILLDLPCDEELWTAETAQEWQNRGGLAAAEDNAISFAGALSTLLTANQRQGVNGNAVSYSNGDSTANAQAVDVIPIHDMRPSTFGCLVLINALHNYIWETRSRHHGRQWTSQETESMFSHIEPALNAWQVAWKANDRHKLERPNPFGLGPLSADSIPLLDLAFVRLFVNLGRSKEAFWQRDFDAMADELARGAEIVQHADGSPSSEELARDAKSEKRSPKTAVDRRASQTVTNGRTSTRRERHLRKAAFYAADSLTIACDYNLTYADATAHELPIQSAMCFFDCCQVLAEWASTVQERVGRFLGVLGRDKVNYTQVPALLMLENEDVELMHKIERICDMLETKRFQQESILGIDLQHMNMHNNTHLRNCGYGSKMLRVSAMMLEKAVVWPRK